MVDLKIDELLESYKSFEISITQIDVCIFDNSKDLSEQLQLKMENKYNLVSHCMKDCKQMIDHFIEFGTW